MFGLKSVIEQRHEKIGFKFAYAKIKAQISCAITAQLISAFVFATLKVGFFLFLNHKFLEHLPIFCSCIGRFVSDRVGKPEDRFCRVAAQL